MQKEIIFKYGGKPSMLEGQELLRMMPNRYLDMVGPFAFLDYFAPRHIAAKKPTEPSGSFAHPHRGIATFTYLVEGEMDHYDSLGNHATVASGGIQWMKSGKGIIHDEQPSMAFQERGGNMHGFQFWINLPALEKARDPEYLPVQSHEIPELQLEQQQGIARVLLGEFGGLGSPIPGYSGQLLLHLFLEPGAQLQLPARQGWEYATLSMSGKVELGGECQEESQLLIFGADGEEIALRNPGTGQVQLLLFGGEPYLEPVVAQGPFIMNTKEEIYQAYVDYGQGKYGKIEYETIKERA